MTTQTAQKNTTQKISELRFPEFSGEWGEKKLGEIFDNIGGTSLEKFVTKNSDYKFISIGNYSKSGKYIDNGQRIELNDKTKTKLLERDNLTMVLNDKTISGDIIGSSILIDKDNKYIYNQRTERLICKKKVFPAFAWQYFNSKEFRKKVFSIAQGGTQIYVNFPSVKKLDFPLPIFPEQQKIAEFLGTVDEWIENLQAQKESLESYKKGIMQKIFSQKIRFRDENGKDFPEWEGKKLGRICEIKKGKQLNKSKLSKDIGCPVINGGISPSGYTEAWNTEGNTIVVSEGGNSCGFVNFVMENFWCGGHCYSLLKLDKSVDLQFLYQNLKFLEKIIMRLRVGSGLPNIQKKDIEKLILGLPVLLEQQKIADFLNSIDDVIESKTNQIAKAKKWKKGLMQKMFV